MTTRRELLCVTSALGLLAAALPACASQATESAMRKPKPLFVYECDATLSEPQDFGATIEGTRRIIPITGGTFQGPRLRGQVLAGSSDWNLSRSDGGNSVEAAYFLRTDDAVTIRIVNKGVRGGTPSEDPASGEKFFMFTLPVFEAPIGKYDWLNRSVFVATLGARRGAKNAVLIRVFELV